MASNSTFVESSTPHLGLVNGQVPYRDGVVSWKLPKVLLFRRGTESFCQYTEKNRATDGLKRVSDGRQRQVFAQIGVQHDYDYPFLFWHFLGNMISQALFEKETSLEILSFTRVNDREFVGFKNKDYAKSNNSTDINVSERPARGIIIQRLRECEYSEGYTSGL
ncbi:DUF572 domain-containing protein [Fusarium denticulatum]|uniref:DUF572 domain-containing protein n=1 Tax=Fusarium denticulatum TaxID=48507 RepID=A0A8H6CTC7_9HYPO|nr:DUF572 domain-containing protein [Fusarium denticulatum]